MSHTTEIRTAITDLSLEEIDLFLKTQKKSHFYKRILFLKYKKQRKTHKEITVLLNVCRKTLTNWMNLFKTGGMKALVSVSYDRRSSKLCSVEQKIRKKAQSGDIETIALCKKWLKEEHDTHTSLSNLGWFFKKNGIVLQKNAACTGKGT